MTRLAVCLVTVLAGLAPAAPAVAASPESLSTVERHLTSMGTELKVIVEAPQRADALAASEAAVRALEATEARLSTWRDDTELARLNAAPVGEPVTLSPRLGRELAAAHRCWRQTRGAFDPAMAALTAVWGLRTGGRTPGDTELRTALEASGFEHVLLDGDTATRRHSGVGLDEGGFGKGAGLAAALEALGDHRGAHQALLDLGGQVAVWGRGEPWSVEVAHPEDRRRAVATIRLGEGSLATSGTAVRGRHLLDPVTGRPAPNFGSVTVWSRDSLTADCLATGLYVMGPDAALTWASARHDVEILILKNAPSGLAAYATPGLAEHLVRLDPGVSLRVLEGNQARATGPSAAKLSRPGAL